MSWTRTLVIPLLVVGMLGVYSYRMLAAESTRVDDAYMFLRYAANILEGNGFAWNPGGPRTYGCTSIPHAFLVAGARALFPNSAGGTLLTRSSAVFGGLALVLLAIAGALHAKSEPLRSPLVVGVLVFPMLVFNEAFLYHASSGMDTMLSFAANCALLCALALVSRAPTMQRALLLALCAYGAFLVRPDNGLYMLLVPTLYLLLILRCGRRITIGFVATLVALLLVDGAAKWIVFGDPMPLSFYVKATGFYDGYAGEHKWNPVREVVDFTLATSPLWGAMVLTAKRCDWRYLAVFLAPLVVTFTYFFSVVQIVGSFYRFYLPSFAFLVVLAIVLLDRWWLDGRRRSLGAGFAARVGLIAAAIGVLAFAKNDLAAAYERVFLDNPTVESYRLRFPETEKLPRLGWWRSIEVMTSLSGRLPAGTTIAASEHGMLGATNPTLRIVDLVGLHDPDFAHLGFSMDRVAVESPALIWFPHDDYVKIRFDIYRDAGFRRDYVFLPTALDYGLAIRRDREDVYRLVSRVLRRVYEVTSLEAYTL